MGEESLKGVWEMGGEKIIFMLQYRKVVIEFFLMYIFGIRRFLKADSSQRQYDMYMFEVSP